MNGQPKNEQANALEMRGVSIHFNDKAVFQDIHCRFRPHAVTGIIGPSGSGKTTLLRTFNRMNDKIDGFRVQGRVFVHGNEIYSNGIDVNRLRRKVGMVFQKPCIFPKSILDNVVFGLKYLHPERRKEFPDLAERYLREVFLWDEVKDRLRRPGHTLSQGQQQRLAIARALIVRPRTLLMDEPTSALDPKSSRVIEELIVSLKKKHTILLVTHNLEQARRVSDETVFVCEGRVCESGRTPDLFANPSCRETQDYIEQGN
ncbi:MAG: phosphate ABC transporter ATP-binding protein [Nitrospinales bacterium]